MAKAQIRTPEGVLIKLDGTPAEITAVLKELGTQEKKLIKSRGGSKKSPPSIGDLVESLVDSKFFKQPKGLTDIRQALAEMGHHYPVTTLSGVMLNLVRQKKLRRQKTDKVWVYGY